MSEHDVVVIGAGPAGLAAAWELAQRGVSVEVLEAEPRVGGMAATVERDGYRFDYGGHRFLTRWPELRERVEKLLNDDWLLVDRHSLIVREGRRIGYPLVLGSLLRSVPWRHGSRYLASYLWEQVRRPVREEANLEGWLLRRFGPALYRDFFAPYTKKLWGLDARRLSSGWAPQRIGDFDLGLALRHVLGISRREPRTYARRFLYPRLGIGQLFSRIAEEIVRLGGHVSLGLPVRGFVIEDGAIRAARTRSGDVRGRHFVVTIPLPDLASQLGVGTRLRFRGVRFLNLMLDAPAELGSTWAYLSDGDGIVSRVQDPERRSPFMVPRGRGSLQLEIPADPGDPIWTLGDDALLERAWGELQRCGVRPRGAVCDFFSTRLARAYPIFDLPARREVASVMRAAERIGNLQLCGRQGRFSYLFMDRAMEDGMAAARRWLGIPTSLPAELGQDRCTIEATSLTA